MKAAILFESLTGNTRRAGELIAANLQQEGWGITAVSPVRRPDMASIQDADVVVVGTWVHGLFVVGQAPWGLGAISHLPALRALETEREIARTLPLAPGYDLVITSSTPSRV